MVSEAADCHEGGVTMSADVNEKVFIKKCEKLLREAYRGGAAFIEIRAGLTSGELWEAAIVVDELRFHQRNLIFMKERESADE